MPEGYKELTALLKRLDGREIPDTGQDRVTESALTIRERHAVGEREEGRDDRQRVHGHEQRDQREEKGLEVGAHRSSVNDRRRLGPKR